MREEGLFYDVAQENNGFKFLYWKKKKEKNVLTTKFKKWF